MRYIKLLMLLSLLVIVAAGSYVFCNFYWVGLRVGERDPGIKNIKAHNGLIIDKPFGELLEVSAGQMMVSGVYGYDFVLYTSKRSVLLEMPVGVWPKRMQADEAWETVFSNGDGVWLAVAPQRYSPGDSILALQLNLDGQVVGEYPWIDLRTGRHVEQLPWGTGVRDLFTKAKRITAEKVSFENTYEGLKGCGEASGREDFAGCLGIVRHEQDLGPNKPSLPASYVVFDDEDRIAMYGVEIDVVEITPEYVRYMLKRVPRGS